MAPVLGRRFSGHAPTATASTVALAAALLASAPQPARAANECGPNTTGTVTCTGASYPTGIAYPAGGNLTIIELNNPNMVITGTQGVSASQSVATSGQLVINVRDIDAITVSGAALSLTSSRISGLAAINIGDGAITSSGGATVSVVTGNGTNALVTLSGGTVRNTGTGTGMGILARSSGVPSTGSASVEITGGSVEAAGAAVTAQITSTNNNPSAASITMSGGSVEGQTGGLLATTTGLGLAKVQMSGGTVAASGGNADGVFASSRAGTYAVDVTGGTITGGSGNGAAIHTSAAAGGTVQIGAGAVINAGASGVALRDGDANKDGIDETGGNATITTAGTVNGAIVLGGGTDSVTVTGGAINGNITGDGVDALNLNLGTNSFTHGAAYAISGIDGLVMSSGTAQLDSTVSANTLTVKGGTLVIGNTANISGPTAIEGGTLAVNGTLNGAVNVLALGRLQGAGTVGSTTVAGTIAPGNSIGTLAINGNYTQLAGSTYQVEVDPASTASDLLRVSGSATLGAGSRLQVVRIGTANYIVGNRYTVLTAAGGVAGSYSLAGDTASAFAQLVDSYDANNVYLTAEKVRSIADAGSTPNQAAVGTALDSLPTSNSVANAVIWSPNDAAARDALNQLSADIHASTKTALLQDSRFVREAAIDRLRHAACAPGSSTARTAGAQTQMPAPQQVADCVPEDRQQHATWGQVFGSWGSIASDGNAAKLERDIGGFMVGADTGLAGGWRVGALGGYSHASADTSARNSSSKTDSYHLGAYGGTQWGATALRLGASRSWNNTDTRRSVAFPGYVGGLKAGYDSTTTQVFGEVGHQLQLAAAVVEPFAGLAHVRLKSDAFSERGGPAALNAEGDSTEATLSTLGVRGSLQAGASTRLRGMLGWRHAFGDTTPTSTHSFSGSVPFTLAGVPLARNVAVLEAGVETQLRPNLALSASYAGQVGNGLRDHGLKLGLNWAF
jgi:outer membrane autotransporter protein